MTTVKIYLSDGTGFEYSSPLTYQEICDDIFSGEGLLRFGNICINALQIVAVVNITNDKDELHR